MVKDIIRLFYFCLLSYHYILVVTFYRWIKIILDTCAESIQVEVKSTLNIMGYLLISLFWPSVPRMFLIVIKQEILQITKDTKGRILECNREISSGGWKGNNQSKQVQSDLKLVSSLIKWFNCLIETSSMGKDWVNW